MKEHLMCRLHIEICYYSVGFESICFHCGSADLVAENSKLNYPIVVLV